MVDIGFIDNPNIGTSHYAFHILLLSANLLFLIKLRRSITHDLLRGVFYMIRTYDGGLNLYRKRVTFTTLMVLVRTLPQIAKMMMIFSLHT